MSDWIDVPVAEVAVGDEVKVDGYGTRTDGGYLDFVGRDFYEVTGIDERDVTVRRHGGTRHNTRRSSIVAVRRRKPEPAPKPGDWRCRKEDGSMTPCIWLGDKGNCHNDSEVFRSGTGWSRDTRTGQPWVIWEDAPAEFIIRCNPGDSITAFKNAKDAVLKSWPPRPGEPVADYYRRIGLDVRPVERRAKR